MVKNIKNALMSKKSKLMISLCAVSALATSAVAFAEDATTNGMAELAENTNVIVGMLKNIMSLFSVYPLNIFLIISIVVAAIVIIKKLKR